MAEDPTYDIPLEADQISTALQQVHNAHSSSVPADSDNMVRSRAVSTAIQTEATARSSADTALDGRVTALENPSSTALLDKGRLVLLDRIRSNSDGYFYLSYPSSSLHPLTRVEVFGDVEAWTPSSSTHGILIPSGTYIIETALYIHNNDSSGSWKVSIRINDVDVFDTLTSTNLDPFYDRRYHTVTDGPVSLGPYFTQYGAGNVHLSGEVTVTRIY
jgi:hypothetical protein